MQNSFDYKIKDLKHGPEDILAIGKKAINDLKGPASLTEIYYLSSQFTSTNQTIFTNTFRADYHECFALILAPTLDATSSFENKRLPGPEHSANVYILVLQMRRS